MKSFLISLVLLLVTISLHASEVDSPDENLSFTAYDVYNLMSREDQIAFLKQLYADQGTMHDLLDIKIEMNERELPQDIESEVQIAEETTDKMNLVSYSVSYGVSKLPKTRHLFYTGYIGGYLFHYGVFQRYVFYNNLRKRPNFEVEISASFRKYLTKFEFVFSKHLWGTGITVGAYVAALRYNIPAIESFEPLYFPVAGVQIGYQYRFKLGRRDHWGRLMVGVTGTAGIGRMSETRGFFMLDATGKIGILLN